MLELTIPLSDEAIRGLKVGDPVLLSGVMITGRDAAHKWMVETFIKKTRPPQGDDLEVYQAIQPLLEGGVIYHCGPGGRRAGYPANTALWPPVPPPASARSPTRAM